MRTFRLSRSMRLACICWTVAGLAVLAIYIADAPWMRGLQQVVVSLEGEALSATYYPGSKPGGVLLLEGFGSDQVALRSAVRELRRQGLYLFTYDFSGHARSPGTLGFDNAQTDRLARQTEAALEKFVSVSGLQNKQILLLGHSLGARVALQTAVLNSDLPAGLILLGAQVNLSPNTQAEFFTGTSDAGLDWVQWLGAIRPDVPILMISGSWDDILTPEAARQLLDKLSIPYPYSPTGRCCSTLPQGSSRKWVMIPALLHNYEFISARVLNEVVTWSGEILNLPVDPSGSFAAARIGLWLLAAAGLWAGLLLAGQAGGLPVSSGGPRILSPRRFLWGKLILWLPALPLAALVSGLVFVLPLGKPVINLIYVGFISGYGILLSILYRLGRMPGVEGKLAGQESQARTGRREAFLAAGLTLGVFAFTAAYARSGWFFVFPLNLRLVWLLLFTPPTALGFWIGLREAEWLRRDGPGRGGLLFWHGLIGLVPFFVYAIFLAVLGSLSGLAGSLQGLVVLGWVLAYGELLQRLTRRAWITALLQSLLLYWLILPQGVLF